MLRRSNIAKISFAAITVIALLLRVSFLTRQSFLLDECYSLFYARSGYWWVTIFWDNNPILYPILLKLWHDVVPISEFNSRFFSVLLSAAGVAAVYHLGKQNKSTLRGLLMATLLATSAVSIRYAQEVRMYSLLEFMSCLFLFAVIKFENQFMTTPAHNASQRWFNLLAAGFGLALTHLFGLVIALFGIIQIALRRPNLKRPLALGLALILLPAVLTLAFQVRFHAVNWQLNELSPSEFALSFRGFLLGFAQNENIVALLMTYFIAWACYAKEAKDRQTARFIMGFISVFFTAAIAYSLLSGRDFFRIRYFIILNPLILWVFAIGIQQMRMRYQICAALVFASFFAKGYAYVNPPWREAAHTVIESQGHAILTSRSIALEMPYYIGHQVNIHQIKSTSKPIEQLDQLLRTNDKVWIVDSALSSRAYLDELLNLAPAHQMKINFNQTFTNGAEDSVVAVEITR